MNHTRQHDQAIRDAAFLVGLEGGELTKFHQGRVRGTPGSPDAYFSFPCGLRGFWECKTGAGRLSKAQREWVDRERAAGGIVLVGDAGDLILEIRKLLKAYRTPERPTS